LPRKQDQPAILAGLSHDIDIEALAAEYCRQS
jgi:hypothetical protein